MMKTRSKMLDVLPDTDGPMSYLPKSMSNDEGSPVIFHDGFGICNREEIISESDCVSIQTDIADNSIDVNFNKSDTNADHLYNQLGSILSHTYKPSKSMYILGRGDKTMNLNDWDKEENMFVGELVEVCSTSSNSNSAPDEILELDKGIKIPKTEKYVFSFDTSEDEVFNFDDTLDSTTPKMYSCPKCKILFNRKSSLVDHTCTYDNYFETDISLYENAEYPIICDAVDDSTDQFSLRKSKKSFSWLPRSEDNEIDEYLEDKIEIMEQFGSIGDPESTRTSDLSFEETQSTEVSDSTSSKTSKRKLKRSKTRETSPLWLCEICDKPFYTKARLKRHLLTHRDRAIICDECGDKMPDYRALANHRSSHHVLTYRNGIPTARIFPCYACSKVFGSRSSQQIHLRIHTGERPYGCRFCAKAFADGGTLRKHERIHTGEKPYVCPICKKAFNQRVVLREHIRAYHAGSNANKDGSFTCEVCLQVCRSSCDLCSHLVKHSDDNTAKHRTPLDKPRKYKKCSETAVSASTNSNLSATSDSKSATIYANDRVEACIVKVEECEFLVR